MKARDPTIVFCRDAKQLSKRRILQSNKVERIMYADFSGEASAHELIMSGLIRLEPSDCRPYQTGRFSSEYRRLISDIGIDNSSVHWWTSSLGTRNRYATNLVSKLDQFLIILNIIDRQKYDKLLMLGVDNTVITEVKKCLRYKEKDYLDLDPVNFVYIVKRYLRSTLSPIVRVLKKTIIVVYRNVISRLLFNKYSNSAREQGAPTVIKTFIFRNSFDNNGTISDRFFGRLPDYLRSQGKRVIILCHINKDYMALAKRISATHTSDIYPYEYFLNVYTILKSMIEVLRYRPKIKNALFFQHDVTSMVEEEYWQSGIAVDQYMFFPAAQRLAKDLKMERFILTCENGGWENACIAGLRQVLPNVRIIGYQHTVVMWSALGMFPTAKELEIKPRPDKILTVGEETRNVLLEHGAYGKDDIETSCALRYEWLGAVKKRTEVHRNGEILLALEGVPQVKKLVTYCIKEFHTLTHYRLRIRTHPELPFSAINSDRSIDLSATSNIVISENSLLHNDLDQADICIYWGSAVALEALSLGIPLIHFNMLTLFSYDPLIQCNSLKWQVSQYDKLDRVIGAIYSMDQNTFQETSDSASRYLSRYFYPVNEERLNKFLR